ncbi:MAG TPA: hypothetical protein VNV85_08585 [Puia sp.]|jgi:hypothetical protein|nr:hypothetical protein [Puia sp.]
MKPSYMHASAKEVFNNPNNCQEHKDYPYYSQNILWENNIQFTKDPDNQIYYPNSNGKRYEGIQYVYDVHDVKV